MSQSYHEKLEKVINYMKAHWPSKVKPEWQVSLDEYPEILKKVLDDFTPAATKNRKLIRIAGISGSGKTTQILPAVEAYCEKYTFEPILVAARRFVEYHPHKQAIENFYGEENLRKNTDEFSTVLMFMTLVELFKNGYDIILDVALLDPEVEKLLLDMLLAMKYEAMFLMIATSPTVTANFLKGRAWRHTKETEEEFIRVTEKALKFYAENATDLRIILWSVYDKLPIYDGPIKNSLEIFADYSQREELPKPDDNSYREAKIRYLTADLN